jgi:thiamine biosynthesis lipoprotein
MGTTLAISVSSESRPISLQALDSAFAAVRRVDDVLNDWRTDTDLARLNHAPPGETVTVGPELRAYLGEVAEWTRRSGRAFDPGIGALVDAWDLRGKGRLPTGRSLERARAGSGLLHFGLEGTSPVAHRPTGASWIDAGGFGKGAALRAAREQLLSAGVRGALLNFSGQVVVLGDTVLLVDVASPRDRLDPVARLQLRDASASTTSQSERFVEIDGRRFGHVIDPRSGTPVPAWGSVTVVHPDPMVADILSTALFVMGPTEGVRWSEAQGVAALFLVSRGDSLEILSTSPIQPLLISHPPVLKGY